MVFDTYQKIRSKGASWDGTSLIGRDMMVQLGLKADFGRKILEWDETVIPMKYPGNFLGQPNVTKREMQ